MNGSPSVFCIILSWNGKALTIDCIRSVLKSDYPNYTIIVVDNASADGSAQAIQSTFRDEIGSGKIILIENPSNKGFAAGNNTGIGVAIQKQADFIFLMNNDTLADKQLISFLISAMDSRQEIGITGPKIYYFEPADQIWFAGGEIFLHKAISRHTGIRSRDTGQHDTPKICDYITGCAMMIRKSVFEKIGMLDTTYPLYSEDADFCMRAKKAGFLCFYEPRGKMWHKISAGTGGQLKWKKIRLRLYSSMIFYKKYAKWYHWSTIPFFQIIELLRVLLLIGTGRIKNN